MPGDTGALVPAWVKGALVPMDKIAVHRLGIRHMAVSVFVVWGDQVLIQQRSLGKYHTPGLWANTCCTHPHWNEAPLACAVRRLDQELGLRGLDPIFCGQVEYRAAVGDDMTEHELVDVFLAKTSELVPLDPDPAEVMATRWISLADLRQAIQMRPHDFTPWLKIYLAEHSRTIFGVC